MPAQAAQGNDCHEPSHSDTHAYAETDPRQCTFDLSLFSLSLVSVSWLSSALSCRPAWLSLAPILLLTYQHLRVQFSSWSHSWTIPSHPSLLHSHHLISPPLYLSNNPSYTPFHSELTLLHTYLISPTQPTLMLYPTLVPYPFWCCTQLQVPHLSASYLHHNPLPYLY